MVILEPAMVIDGQCDHCRSPYKVDEALAGRRAQCDTCGHVFTIPAPVESPPAPPAPPDARAALASDLAALAEQAKPAAPAEPTGLHVLVPAPPPPHPGPSPASGAGLALLLLVGLLSIGIGIAAVLVFAPPPSGRDIGPLDSAAASRPADGDEDNAHAAASAPASRAVQAGLDRQPGASGKSPACTPAGGRTAEDHTATTFGARDVIARTVGAPAVGAFRRAIHPGGPSDLIGLVTNGAGGESVEIWSLQTYKRVGSIRFAYAADGYALSTGGRHLVRLVGTQEVTAEVWSPATGKRVRKLSLGSPSMHEVVGFYDDGHLVVKRWMGIGTALEVWDAATGERLRRVSIPGWSRSGFAFSPDAGVCALVAPQPQQAELAVYDLGTGLGLGHASLPAANGGGAVKPAAAAFSHDGQKVTVLLPAGTRWRLLTYDARTGDLASDVASDFDGVRPAHIDADAPGAPGFDWLPDGRGWLVLGGLAIDATTGRCVGRLGVPGVTAQRFIGRDLCALVTNDAGGTHLAMARLDAPRLEARLREAHADVRAVMEPPALAQPRWTDAPVGTLYPARVTWRATPDPAPLPPEEFAPGPIKLNDAATASAEVRFSSPDVAHAVVLNNVRRVLPGRLLTGPPVLLERYDLATGERLARLEVPTRSRLLGASPDGTRALLAVPASPVDPRMVRLDVWSLARGRHETGWRPYGGGPGGKAAVTWAEMVDNEHVLTSNGDKLVLWSLGDRRAVWAVGGVAGTPVLTPGRRYVAVRHGQWVRFLDTTSRMPRGDLSAPMTGDFELLAGAVRSDGAELAAILQAATGRYAVQWNLETGRVRRSFRTTVAGPLAYLDDRHLLAGGAVVDTTRQAALDEPQEGVALYDGPGDVRWHLGPGPQGRGLFLHPAPLPRGDD